MHLAISGNVLSPFCFPPRSPPEIPYSSPLSESGPSFGRIVILEACPAKALSLPSLSLLLDWTGDAQWQRFGLAKFSELFEKTFATFSVLPQSERRRDLAEGKCVAEVTLDQLQLRHPRFLRLEQHPFIGGAGRDGHLPLQRLRLPAGGEEEEEEEEEEYSDEGPLFAWETLGGDVAVFHTAGGLVQASRYEGRVRSAPEAGVRRGDWSLVLEGVQQSDAALYECILPDKRTLSTVWLRVATPQEQSLDVEGLRGDSVALPCRGPQLQKGLTFQWEKEGVGLVLDSRKEEDRVHVWVDVDSAHLRFRQLLPRDRGVYHCFYVTRWKQSTRFGQIVFRYANLAKLCLV
ncbi:hypothetical protein CRUP_027473 [Coryphaenoides rupestris]|nr:hypothetical protein CRUP_027473 [Coryphaenoides rupestris]